MSRMGWHWTPCKRGPGAGVLAVLAMAILAAEAAATLLLVVAAILGGLLLVAGVTGVIVWRLHCRERDRGVWAGRVPPAVGYRAEQDALSPSWARSPGAPRALESPEAVSARHIHLHLYGLGTEDAAEVVRRAISDRQRWPLDEERR